ncbi:ABC transporter C family member 3 [Spinacia oleracea]|uniref:ABC-type xenobiotic transporter n=1 Tax=Spinacia oleracea TaxID=3562 RepID=A0ABM3RTF8_SPIOL|nr:ABC transporter C family member 3-like [Spinacia oleracea]XP_056698804.1 ABC transporter C family member 3-like [Spinacia oleracea]XP_056698805.1 ABC transporter C family member 3-like [Spinacia oleracea]XP_056698806.1 ABC transporter C family member 3-like [Spinacia oleracea]XP_056698807.1 ABC transporter C family member 3-like [Spinacia oleracea]XP_056698808.1 ABC transporter C family member 3-like [Spinacia oleracea]XP_056698809.1 ABC transporter C family member 3-like [Spinacia olerace
MGISLISYFLSPLKYPPLDFLQNPIFLRESSVFIHLILLFGIILSWIYKLSRRVENEHSKDRNFWYYKPVFLPSLALSLYNLALFCLNCFYWYRNGWLDANLVTLLDLTLRVFVWLLVSIYLHKQFIKRSNGVNLPILLRIWWVFYLVVSCYCLVVDIVQLRGKQSLPIQVLVSDIVYVMSGIFLCCVGIFGKVTCEDSDLQEPFLNGNGNVNGNGRVESSKNEGSGTISPYLNAGLLSNLTFTWVGSLITKGYKKTLDLEDVPSLSGKDDVNESHMIFRNFMESSRDGSDKKVTSMRLVRSLILTTWVDIVLTACLCLIRTLASYVGPYLIDTFVQYLNGKREFKNQGYVLVSAFFVAKLVECLSQRHWVFRLQVVGIRAKAVLIESIYNKALTLSCRSKQGHTSGEMINLMSVDAERIGDFSWYMHDPWMVIIQVALALLLLYKSLGLASIAALIATVIIMLANFPLSTVLEKYQGKLMESKDKRMKATSEVLKNMRILKLQAWEMKFLSKIVELRNTENGWLKKFLYTSAATTFVFWVAPTFVSVITFGTCIIMGIPLDSGKILTALATFRILQEAIYNLPDTISMIIQTKVSLDRIASFLCLDDLEPDTIEKIPRASSEVAVEINEGNFTWDPSSPNPTLKDINLRVQHGMRVAVCGTVGSGKSSLLSCILGEVPKITGSLRLSGSKAYVPQSPWIQSGKIVDNILFGQEMDHERYDRVLEACSLKKDLEILSFGDQTVIGERGINLSGGQKQRMQIARALYQDADIYLFDDPFSAVDAHTGSHLFKECLLGLLESKTVIYVTHQVEFLPAADLILVMKNGRILQAGKYNDILASGTDFMELVGAHEEALSALDSVEPGVIKPTVHEEYSGTKPLEEESNVGEDGKADDMAGIKGQLVQEEEREKGRVGLSVYWKYITTAYGGALIPFILLAQILFQTLQILSNYWMAWATPVSPDAKPTVDEKTLIMVYVALSVGSAFCILARASLLMNVAYKTATSLFTKMHSCIFRAPMSFFDATPSGRILNRASTDQSAVDLSIPSQVGAFAFSLIQLLGIIAVMSMIAWQVFVIFIPVIAISLWYQQYYISSARELCRLVGVTKAPVIQHFAETISGATTIRSFDQESRFCQTSVQLVNTYSRPKFYNAAAMEWLCIRLDMLSSITFAASLIFLISIPVGLIDPGIAGLSVTYGLNLNMLQVSLIWNLCNMENKIISVERIYQYTCIPSEPPLFIEENRPVSFWPSLGEVNVQDLQIRYAPHMPLVLRGITCTFQGGKKTGIVGRTGGGKSTLIQALFRIVEPASGKIMLDGIDISSIGLHDLRTRLSIIPQDPTMFEGTVRSNLDPLEEYSDEQIWEALDKCQLGDEVRTKEGKLDSIVTENGENWSMGQRQLVCLGRVLLKRSKVLILDEATASVDTATDNLIQQTLSQHFSDSTVIIIAHRITSVIDSDMVVLLSHGLVEECDSPLKLLENKSSSFAKLVTEYTTRANSNAEETT